MQRASNWMIIELFILTRPFDQIVTIEKGGWISFEIFLVFQNERDLS